MPKQPPRVVSTSGLAIAAATRAAGALGWRATRAVYRNAYLRSDHMRAVSAATRALARGRCQARGCRRPGTACHHVHYRSLGRERPGVDTRWLCDQHHVAADARRRARTRRKRRRR